MTTDLIITQYLRLLAEMSVFGGVHLNYPIIIGPVGKRGHLRTGHTGVSRIKVKVFMKSDEYSASAPQVIHTSQSAA